MNICVWVGLARPHRQVRIGKLLHRAPQIIINTSKTSLYSSIVEIVSYENSKAFNDVSIHTFTSANES